MLTHEQLADIRQRAEAATPGPWHGDRYDGTVKYQILSGVDNVAVYNCGDCHEWTYGFLTSEDETFAMHARADIPALLAEVEELQERLNDAEADSGRLREERTTADVASVRWEQESGRLQQENAQLRAALAEITQINGDDPTMRRIEQIIAQHR